MKEVEEQAKKNQLNWSRTSTVSLQNKLEFPFSTLFACANEAKVREIIWIIKIVLVQTTSSKTKVVFLFLVQQKISRRCPGWSKLIFLHTTYFPALNWKLLLIIVIIILLLPELLCRHCSQEHPVVHFVLY